MFPTVGRAASALIAAHGMAAIAHNAHAEAASSVPQKAETMDMFGGLGFLGSAPYRRVTYIGQQGRDVAADRLKQRRRRTAQQAARRLKRGRS